MKHTMKIMSPHYGHEALVWDSLDTEGADVQAAADAFCKSLEQGCAAFDVKAEKRMDKFDPAVEEIMIIAPMQGGRR